VVQAVNEYQFEAAAAATPVPGSRSRQAAAATAASRRPVRPPHLQQAAGSTQPACVRQGGCPQSAPPTIIARAAANTCINIDAAAAASPTRHQGLLSGGAAREPSPLQEKEVGLPARVLASGLHSAPAAAAPGVTPRRSFTGPGMAAPMGVRPARMASDEPPPLQQTLASEAADAPTLEQSWARKVRPVKAARS
jgi:hypothetical protein